MRHVWDVCVLATLETVFPVNSVAFYTDAKLTQILIKEIPFLRCGIAMVLLEYMIMEEIYPINT